MNGSFVLVAEKAPCAIHRLDSRSDADLDKLPMTVKVLLEGMLRAAAKGSVSIDATPVDDALAKDKTAVLTFPLAEFIKAGSGVYTLSARIDNATPPLKSPDVGLDRDQMPLDADHRDAEHPPVHQAPNRTGTL